METTLPPVIATTKEDSDCIASSIGAFGLWQGIITSITSSIRFLVIFNALSIVYMTPKTDFKCVEFANNSAIEIKNRTCYKECVKYEYYYDSVFEDTLISRFDLICENDWKVSFTQTMIMFGFLLGVSALGWVSDRFGRYIAIRISISFATVFMIAASFAPNYWIFTILRFFCGFGTGGAMSLAVIVSVEVVGPQYKDFIGFCNIFPDGFFAIALAVIAYLSPTWNCFLLAGGLITILHLTAIFIMIPETPRWLISQRKRSEAVELMTYVAKFNNLDTSHIIDNVNNAIENTKSNDAELDKKSFIDLFRRREIARITICSWLVWLIAGVCLYGINQYSMLIGSNMYIIAGINALFQFIGSVISTPVNKYLKRKIGSILLFSIIGLAMTIMIFVSDDHWLTVLLANIGLTAIISAMCVLYVQANELYPTPLRNMGFGVCSSGNKLGAMIAPFVANMKPQWMASTIFAVVPFVAILFSLLLPETKGKKLKDTID